MATDHKQVLFAHDSDTEVIAKTPSESGLSLNTLIDALREIVEKSNDPDKLVVIFEDDEVETSWTIQQVAYDRMWVRLS